MRFITAALSVLLGAASPAADVPVRSSGRAALSVDPPALARHDLRVAWRLPLPVRPIERVEYAELVDEHLYARTDRGVLFAIRAESGLVRWQSHVAEPGDFVFPIRHAAAPDGNGNVIVTRPASLALLDRATGEELARFHLRTPPSAPAIADAQQFYVSSANQRLIGYRRSDGFALWNAALGGVAAGWPLLGTECVLAAAESGRVLSAATDDGRAVWTAALEGRPLHPVTLSPADLFVSTEGRFVYCLNPARSIEGPRIRWRHRLNGQPSEGPSVLPDVVLQFDPVDGLVALERSSGRRRWAIPNGRHLLAHSSRTLYILSTADEIMPVDSASGQVRGAIPVRGAVHAITNVRNDAIYLADRSGAVLCIRRQDARPLVASDFLSGPPPATTRTAMPSWPRPTSAPATRPAP